MRTVQYALVVCFATIVSLVVPLMYQTTLAKETVEPEEIPPMIQPHFDKMNSVFDDIN